MEKIAAEVYPEAPSALHTQVTAKAIEHLFAAYTIAEQALVLDVGCGQGVALQHFVKRGCRPVGITLNTTDLEECRRQGYTVAQMDQSFLDFEDSTFDLVWARHVVEHSIFPYFTLTEFARILKPGGLLYLEVPGAETSCKHELNRNHYSILSRTMWCSLLERSGFSITEEQTYFLKNEQGPDEYWGFFGVKPGGIMPEEHISTTARASLSVESFAAIGSQQPLSATEEAMLAAVAASHGLVTDSEALALHRISKQLPAGARILEIGSYLGASTTAIGHAILGKEIDLYCLDCWHDYVAHGFIDHPWVNSAHPGNEVLLKFLETTAFINSQLRILKGTTEQFRTLLPASFFDLIFIDAGHDYDSVLNDLLISMRALVPGGLLLGHDYHSDGHGVVAAVNQVIYESRSITVKGIIPGTSIWYAVVNDPLHELANLTVSGLPRPTDRTSAPGAQASRSQ